MGLLEISKPSSHDTSLGCPCVHGRVFGLTVFSAVALSTEERLSFPGGSCRQFSGSRGISSTSSRPSYHSLDHGLSFCYSGQAS